MMEQTTCQDSPSTPMKMRIVHAGKKGSISHTLSLTMDIRSTLIVFGLTINEVHTFPLGLRFCWRTFSGRLNGQFPCSFEKAVALVKSSCGPISFPPTLFSCGDQDFLLSSTHFCHELLQANNLNSNVKIYKGHHAFFGAFILFSVSHLLRSMIVIDCLPLRNRCTNRLANPSAWMGLQ
jgi:hypothetical protein